MSNLKSSSGSTSSCSPWSCNSLLWIQKEHSWVPQLSLPSSLNLMNAFLKSFFYVIGFLTIHRYIFYQFGFVTLARAYCIHWPFLCIIFITIEIPSRRIIYKLHIISHDFSNICYRNIIKLHSPLYWFLPLFLNQVKQMFDYYDSWIAAIHISNKVIAWIQI